MSRLPINLLSAHHQRQKQKRFWQQHITLRHGLLAFAALVTTVGISNALYNQPLQVSNPKIQNVKVSMQGGIEPRGAYVPPSVAKALAEAKQNQLIQPEVLGDSTTLQGGSNIDLTSQIQSVLNSYLAQGKFKGDKGDPGAPGVAQSASHDNGGTTSVIGGNPIVTYVPSQPQNNFSGETVAGFTQLSSQNLTSDTANINSALNVPGSANFTGNANFTGSTNLTGTTTIANLNISGFNPGFTGGSVIFQGSSGLAQDNSNLYYDALNHRLGIGTTTPTEALSVQGNINLTGNIYQNGSLFTSGGSGTSSPWSFIGTSTNINYNGGSVFVGSPTTTINSSANLAFSTNINTPGSSVNRSAMVVGPDGFMRILYIDGNDVVQFTRCKNTDCTLAQTTSQQTTATYATLAIGQDGFARIAYSDVDSSNLDFIQCMDINCSSTSTSTIGSNTFDDFISMAIGQDGFARIVYMNDSQGLNFAQCTNANCSTGNISVLDSDVSGVPTVAIGQDGFARISYTDFISQDLKFIQCTNAACSTGNTTSVLPASADQNDGIVMAPSGFAEIVYTDSVTGSLALLQCTNAACTTSTTAVIDSSSDELTHFYDAANSNSVTLDSNGFINVAYTDDDTGDLKFAQCANANCSLANTSVVAPANGGFNFEGSVALSSDGTPNISFNDDNSVNLVFTRLNSISFNPSSNSLSVAGSLGVKSNIVTDASILINKDAQVGGSLLVGASSANLTVSQLSQWKILQPDTSVGIGQVNAISADSQGLPEVAYSSNSDAGDQIKFLHCNDADCSSVSTSTIAALGGEGPAIFISLASGADGFARVSYIDTNANLNFIRCQDINCSIVSTSTVATGGLHGVSMAIGQDGFARIAFAAGDNRVHYIQCTNADCSTNNTADLADGIYPSIAIAADGFARIAYQDIDAGDNLSFIECTNDDCSSKVTTIGIDPTSGGIYQPSIAINSDDNDALISYSDNNNELKYIQCLDDACATQNITNLTSTGSQSPVSVSVATNGEFGISYININDSTLRFITCSNDNECAFRQSNILPSSSDILTSTALTFNSNNEPVISYYVSNNSQLLKVAIFGEFFNNFNAAETASSGYIQGDLGVNGNIYGDQGLTLGGSITSNGLFNAPVYNFQTDDGDSQTALFINNSGQVGIGTQNPRSVLDVESTQETWINRNDSEDGPNYYGNLRVGLLGTIGDDAGNTIAFDLGDASGTRVSNVAGIASYWENNNPGSYASALGFELYNPSPNVPQEQMVLDHNGLGLGTTTPTALLSVQDQQGVGDDLLEVSATGTGASYFHITSQGKVGIGTSTPNQALQVVGSISNIDTPNTTISQIATTSVGSVPLSIYVSGHYAYVANGTGNTISVVDISNPAAPSQVSITSLSGGNIGLNAVYVSGRYAYLAGGASIFFVVDISNPSSPVVTATTSLPSAHLNGMYVSGHYAYVVGHSHSSDATIYIVDISNPAAPVQVGILSSSTTNDPNSVYVSGRYAYVTNSAGNSLSVVDISNPAAPVQVATTSVGSGPNSVYVSGRYAYVANSVSNTISVVDISNPAAPVQVATTSVGSGPNSVYVSGRYAYVANSVSNTISVVDISNPLTPLQVATASVGSGPSSVYVSGRYAYVANSVSNTISVVDISGTETTSLIAGSADLGNLQVGNDALINGQLQIQGGINVGAGGILSGGALAISATSSPSYFADSVGIGTSSPQYLLQVGSASVASGTVARFQNANGTCDINPTTNTLACSSDSRLKKDINPLTDGFSQIMALQPVYFNWNAEPSSTPEHPGFIAQAVQQVMPSIVSTDPQSGLLSIGYSDIVPALVGAVQQEQNEIELLQGTSASRTLPNMPITILRQINFSGDTVGEAKILAGATLVRINFAQNYEFQPIVTITAEGQAVVGFITGKDASGFTINITSPTGQDVIFDWHAFGGDGSLLTVSDGSSSNIQLVVPAPPVPDDSPSGGSSTTTPPDSTTTPDSGNVLGDSTTTPDSPTSTPPTVTPTPDTSTTTP